MVEEISLKERITLLLSQAELLLLHEGFKNSNPFSDAEVAKRIFESAVSRMKNVVKYL
jgi:hypothetical protein